MMAFTTIVEIGKMFTAATYFTAALLSMCEKPLAIEVADRHLRVGSWNIRIFGQSKISDQKAVDTILKILNRYDLLAIQEIRDSQETALQSLVTQLNQYAPEKNYQFSVSGRLGRSSSKEQYAFIYNPHVFEVISTYQHPYDDDLFERPPYAVVFKSTKSEVPNLAIINIHTSPSEAVQEINALTSVYRTVQNLWSTSAVLIAGDFNADCTYVKSREMKNISLRANDSFMWLIDDIQDTTVSSTDCSYDRFVTDSHALYHGIVPGSIIVYNYDRIYALSPDQAEDISDHYPIEFMIKGKVNREIQRHHSLDQSFTVKDSVAKDLTDLRSLYNSGTTLTGLQNAGFHAQPYKIGTRLHHVTVVMPKSDDVIRDMRTLQNLAPNVVGDITIGLVKAALQSRAFVDRPYVPGLAERDLQTPFGAQRTITLFCGLQNLVCQVSITTKIN